MKGISKITSRNKLKQAGFQKCIQNGLGKPLKRLVE